jgi:hypothetical protein
MKEISRLRRRSAPFIACSPVMPMLKKDAKSPNAESLEFLD